MKATLILAGFASAHVTSYFALKNETEKMLLWVAIESLVGGLLYSCF